MCDDDADYTKEYNLAYSFTAYHVIIGSKLDLPQRLVERAACGTLCILIADSTPFLS
jgi:hypothetical protein